MVSPARKRQRLSSPEYHGGLDELNSDDLEELDRIEMTLSQLQRQTPIGPTASQKMSRSSQALSPSARKRRMKAIMDALVDSDHKSVSASSDPVHQDAGQRYRKNTTSVQDRSDMRHRKSDSRSSSSQSEAQSRETTVAGISMPMFQHASMNVPNASSDEPLTSEGFPEDCGFATLGFSSAAGARGKKVLKPSKAALERAEKEQKDWSVQDEDWVKKVVLSPASPKRTSESAEPSRAPLAPLSNSPSVQHPRSPQRTFSTPLLNRTAAQRARGFKSPFLRQNAPNSYSESNPSVVTPSKSSVSMQNSSTDFESPVHHLRVYSESALQFTTPVRPAPRTGYGSITRNIKPAFSTPFKKGMAPGEPGRQALEKSRRGKKLESARAAQVPLNRSKPREDGKIPLECSGLKPQQYTSEELEDMGVNIAELGQITPQTALFYVFHTSASHVLSNEAPTPSNTSLGPAEALKHLLRTGRKTTKEWVDNHWALVLWKLAGLAVFDPARENSASRRWCWRAVLEQLEARHDREFKKGLRPALRLITTGDAPAGSPLVLVVTAILSTEGQQTGPNGKVLQEASAEVEVSDGWYRLRALLDAPLSRAVIKGKIRPGMKISVAGAKLENERKDPCEIWQAYNSCTLLLSGNGSHLAPWHARLGFRSEPFIATLGSLTADGGHVPLVEFVVEKVYPIAYIEFQPGDKPGEKKREEPRGEAEELLIEDAWRKRREAAETKAREELDERWNRWEGFADRLERAAGTKFSPSADEMPPDRIEDLFDELDDLPPSETGTFIRQLSTDECGWLARHLRRRIERDREHAVEEIESEVNHVCPPREVRNFRIVQIRDARTSRKPANRIAHLCIWDVLSLCVSEGGRPGAIEPGQRFLMSNLVPTQHNCWMGQNKDDIVYLSTTRRSRFYRLK